MVEIERLIYDESIHYAIKGSINHHREDGPAIIKYYNKDMKKLEYVKWCNNGVLHRLDGPSSIRYDEMGNVTQKSYFIYGQEYESKEVYEYILRSAKEIRIGVGGKSRAIMNIKHPSEYIQEACKEALNG